MAVRQLKPMLPLQGVLWVEKRRPYMSHDTIINITNKQTNKNTTSLKAKINFEGFSMLSYKIPQKKKSLKAETSPLKKV